jgi:uncharacterized protein (DUF1330 family)
MAIGAEIYVVVEIQEVFDPDALAEYQAQARQQLLERGGVLVARGNCTFEGSPPVGQTLVQRWPSEAAFREWQESDDYRPLLERRKSCVRLRIAILGAV